MPSIFQTPVALAKVALSAPTVIDAANTALIGCQVGVTGTGNFFLTLDQPIGPNELAVYATPWDTGNGATSNLFNAQVDALPAGGDTPPDTSIRIFFLRGDSGLKVSPGSGFLVRVDRVKVGS